MQPVFIPDNRTQSERKESWKIRQLLLSMTTYYLRNFVENVSDMPAELSRRFKLMREIDEKAHALQAEAEAASRKQLEEAALKVCRFCQLLLCHAGKQRTHYCR